MGRACRTYGENTYAYGFLVGKQITQVIPRGRWEDDNKMDLRKIAWGDMDWIDLAQDRDQWTAIVNTIMKIRVPLNVEKYLGSLATGGFSRRTQLHGVSGR
jgi:hypothetical protein